MFLKKFNKQSERGPNKMRGQTKIWRINKQEDAYMALESSTWFMLKNWYY